jgi:hypothetical protein
LEFGLRCYLERIVRGGHCSARHFESQNPHFSRTNRARNGAPLRFLFFGRLRYGWL